MSLSSCPNCGKFIGDANTCPDCGRQPGRKTPLDPQDPPRICLHCQAANPTGRPRCARCDQPFRYQVGSVLYGRYRLAKAIKEGGFGAVYKATDTQRADQPVAIKEMLVSDPKLFDKHRDFILRESHILDFLNSKQLSVPEKYAFLDSKQDRTAHLVLEFIAGRDLLEVMTQTGGKRFPLELVIGWGKSICDILDAMHEARFIHRDVKPGNIMLLDDGKSIKMIDFGTARDFERLTRGLTRIYSEDYAAPEQVLGSPEPRSDLFSLAATLYHLVTGDMPRGLQTGDKLRALLADPGSPIPTDERWFYELLMVNLDANKDRRHPSARQFKDDLSNKRLSVRSGQESDWARELSPFRATDGGRGELHSPRRQTPATSTVLGVPVQSPPITSTILGVPLPDQDDDLGLGLMETHPPAETRSSRRFSWALVFLAFGLLAVGIALSIRPDWLERLSNQVAGQPGATKPHAKSSGKVSTGKAGAEPAGAGQVKVARARITKPVVMNVIYARLKNAPDKRRPYLRFFTLDHFYNNPKLSNKDLDQCRAALSWLLGQYARIGKTSLAAIDPAKSVFELDVRETGWDKSGGWRTILAANPYGLLDEAAGKLGSLTGADPLPFVRADWFVVAASRAPLFTELHPDKLPPPDLPESIARVRALYEKDLEPEDAAFELGLVSAKEFQARIQGSDARKLLTRLDLAPLGRGESIPRQTWARAGGLMSPFQQMAAALGLGPAYNPSR